MRTGPKESDDKSSHSKVRGTTSGTGPKESDDKSSHSKVCGRTSGTGSKESDDKSSHSKGYELAGFSGDGFSVAGFLTMELPDVSTLPSVSSATGGSVRKMFAEITPA